MLARKRVMPHLAVLNIAETKDFYHGTLGLPVLDESEGHLMLNAGGTHILAFKHADPQPSERTLMGWEVEDVDEAVETLTKKGVKFEFYDGFDQDEKGISRSEGRVAAWIKDPSGHVLSIMQEE